MLSKRAYGWCNQTLFSKDKEIVVQEKQALPQGTVVLDLPNSVGCAVLCVISIHCVGSVLVTMWGVGSRRN